MERQVLTGSRIRVRRVDLGLKQSDLAHSAGISASYLNLIEHNRRNIGGKLLTRLARALEIDPVVLSQIGDTGLATRLQDVALSHEGAIERDRLDDFMTRFPGWAGLIAEQAEQIKGLEQVIGGLNDRLTHDPFLSEKMHEILAAVSAIRSTASILVATPEINADWRARFHGNIDMESRRLADTSAAMALHFDQLTQSETVYATPLEVVLAFLEQHNYAFPAIETALETGEAPLDTLLSDPAFAADPRSRDMARAMLERYCAEARHLPLAEFSNAAEKAGYAPAKLAQQYGAPLDVIFRRLASLALTPDRPEIGLVACDTSGAIVFRKAPSGFDVPRFGLACPLWPVFTALRTPGTAISQRVEGPNGATYQAYASATPVGPPEFDRPPVHIAWMLLVEVEPDATAALPLGASCRVCARPDCTARREPSILTPTPE